MDEVFVGVDISKERLDVHVRPTAEDFSVSNDPEGIDQLVARLRRYDKMLVVVEATGGFERMILQMVGSAGIPIALVNPRQVRDFAKAVGRLAKTDRIDARVLAHFAQAVGPAPYKPKGDECTRLSALVVRRRQLVSMRASEKCVLLQSPEALKDGVRQHIAWLSKSIKEVETAMLSEIENAPELRELDSLIRSVPGVGPVTSAVVLSAMPELGKLCRRRLAALAGIAPLNNDSGRKQSPRKCWGGRAEVRAALYMAAVAAVRVNPVIRAHYAALKSHGKPSKVALVACARKLLTLLNAIVRRREPFRLVEPLLKAS